MHSFSKSKLQTAVVVFLTVLMMGEVGWGQATGSGFPINPPNGYMSKEQVEREEKFREDCKKEANGDAEKARRCFRDRMQDLQPFASEQLCSDLRKQMNESITKCPSQTCQEIVNTCTSAGESPESENIVNALLMQTTGFGINSGQSGYINCNITYSEHRSEQKERMADVEAVQKDLNKQNDDSQKDQEDFQKAMRDIEKDQRDLKKQQQDLAKESKTKLRESYQKQIEDRMKLDAQVRQTMLEISQMRSKLLQMTNAKKKMLGNFDVNNFVRACRGEYVKSRAEYCAKTKDNCKQQVYTSVGTAFTMGSTDKNDRVANFDNCVKNTLADYSAQIDNASEDIKQMQAQIVAKNEALESAKEAQKKSDEFMIDEMNQMKQEMDQQMLTIAEAYQSLEKQKMELQTNFQTKQIENFRRRMDLNNRLGMKTSFLGQVGSRPRKIHKDLTGNEAIAEVGKQQGYRQDAERLGCCKSGYANTELCKESNAAKNLNGPKKKSSASGVE